MSTFILRAAFYEDEPLPVANAHALHAAPPQPALQPPAAPSQAPAAPPVPFAHTKDDALNQAESKLNEDKLQVVLREFVADVLCPGEILKSTFTNNQSEHPEL
ncbi:hypothetical protein EVAR_49350_1 [Eumeta japonica]|uniref:Uncharacterized protein n=1 Tax=Eumeta variegata TaxID=151549 RepID=A0A4C1XTZ1_EUMVA|nr:hypothetical protein EVAR_49350_1 [Eumeta japonica]